MRSTVNLWNAKGRSSAYQAFSTQSLSSYPDSVRTSELVFAQVPKLNVRIALHSSVKCRDLHVTLAIHLGNREARLDRAERESRAAYYNILAHRKSGESIHRICIGGPVGNR